MSKKRTRAQKIKAQNKNQAPPNPFNAVAYNLPATHVNSYFKKDKIPKIDTMTVYNNPVKTEQYSNLKLIKKDLIKSLIIASFILCLEVVIYLLWYKK